MQLLRDVIHCDCSFAIHNPLAKVARLKYMQNITKVRYYFYQLAYWDLKVSKRFVGLNQIHCSPSFDWYLSKNNDPAAC